MPLSQIDPSLSQSAGLIFISSLSVFVNTDFFFSFIFPLEQKDLLSHSQADYLVPSSILIKVIIQVLKPTDIMFYYLILDKIVPSVNFIGVDTGIDFLNQPSPIPKYGKFSVP